MIKGFFMQSTLTWIKFVLVSLFFFFQFLQMTMFNTLALPLMADFHLNPTQISYLSALFFLTCAILSIPAGILVDKYSLRKIILFGMAFSILNLWLMQQSQDLTNLYLIRIFQGIVHAFCFISIIKLATYYFPSRHMALATGILVTIGMLGGAFAQKPLAVLIHNMGWRQTLTYLTVFGCLIWITLFFVIDTFKDDVKSEKKYFYQFKNILSNRQNWLAGLYASLINLPLMILGGLWGNQYLVATQKIDLIAAASICSMLFIGTLFGAPLIGYISDKLGRRCLPMTIASILALILLISINVIPLLDIISLHLLFLAIGIITSSQIIIYPLISESNQPAYTGTALAISSVIVFSGPLVFQPLFGLLIQYYNFQIAFLILPATLFLSFICSSFLKDNYGKKLK